jgi:two-component sensor histidine kinase
MTVSPQAAAVLELSGEPQLILRACSEVLAANAAARRRFGPELEGLPFASLLEDRVEPFLDLLRRCQRTSGALPGAVQMGRPAEARRLMFMARRLPDRLVGLHFRLQSQERFEALSRQIAVLDREVAQRRRVQLELEQSLSYNALLLRELQHRVKNMIQVLCAIMTRSAARSENAAFKESMALARARLLAAEKAHSLLHNVGANGAADLRELIETVGFALRDSFGLEVEVRIEAPEGVVVAAQETTPIALIINELVTNAYKHGAQHGLSRIDIRVHVEDAALVLRVSDDGPGLEGPAPPPEGFGLSLVRGLARQLGGTLQFFSGPGLTCEIAAPRRSAP